MLTNEQKLEFCQIRREVISGQFPNLNQEQRQAVLATEGPLMLLAGAGSGKTTVLVHRIVNLIRYGRGSDSQEVPEWVTEEDLNFLKEFSVRPSEDRQAQADRLCSLEPAAPWSVLAITFTNKAAGEMKERLNRELGAASQDVWASTFHSACVRILRRNIERLGFPSTFTIYDAEDSLRLIRECMRNLKIDEKIIPPRTVVRYISRAKDSLLLAADYAERYADSPQPILPAVSQIYTAYEKHLWEAGALDFDDILLHTVRLLRQEQDVLEYYQKKFRYVLIDEYQDTNHLQYLFSALMTGKSGNFCVVGDDDQSIYRFRGATIENILNFEKQYKGCRIIRLEQNYRSTRNILDAANAVIRNNRERKGKNMWTAGETGERIRRYAAENEKDEAQYVAEQVMKNYRAGGKWSDHAVLYRVNAQSNQIEIALKRNGIPYRVIGGTKFFERAEVKDMLAYLCVVQNHADDLRLIRILNNPPRGIGGAAQECVRMIAAERNLSLWDVISHAETFPELERFREKLDQFALLILELTGMARSMSLPEFYGYLIQRSGYEKMLQEKGEAENRTRLENIRELQSSISDFADAQGEQASLAGFLDEVALYTDLDSQSAGEDVVVLMTIHSAKGLEFPCVFVTGMEEGIFPDSRSTTSLAGEEEERRLCYVAMTRAKKHLHLIYAAQRMLYGKIRYNSPSRFLEEIPEELLDDMEWEIPESREEIPSIRENSGQTERRKASKNPRFLPERSDRGFTASPKQAEALPDYREGDVVEHKAFGRGTILSRQDMGGDALMEISFDQAGIKRLMLKSTQPYLKKK